MLTLPMKVTSTPSTKVTFTSLEKVTVFISSLKSPSYSGRNRPLSVYRDKVENLR